jgi:hypothetical protein
MHKGVPPLRCWRPELCNAVGLSCGDATVRLPGNAACIVQVQHDVVPSCVTFLHTATFLVAI